MNSMFKNAHDCEIAINAIKMIGGTVPAELYDQLAKLKKVEANSKEEKIYDHFARTVPYSAELMECIETTVDKLMEDGPNATVPGLLLGKIQCGKTRAFVGVVGLAFDRGFDDCIVLTKGTNALVTQTVNRLKSDFHDYLGIDNRHKSCSVDIYDIMDLKNGLSSAQINGVKNIIVCKKEHTNVNRLLALFQQISPELKNKKILIIDDEADFVSHSFRIQHQQVYQGTVACLIDKFIRLQSYCRYLQVTATPYSLYLQPDGEVAVENGRVFPFRPRFTSLVPIHDHYIGGHQFFVESHSQDSLYSNVFHRVSDQCLDRMLVANKDMRLFNNVATSAYFQDLRWAMMSYFVGSAIRKIQVFKKEGYNYLTSFLMHLSINKEDHEWQSDLLYHLLDEWRKDVSSIRTLFQDVFSDILDSIQKGRAEGLIQEEDPLIEDVWDKVVWLLDNKCYQVQSVNSEVSVPSLLDDNGQLKLTHDLNIFVGGFVLDRGITIDHMLGFMYGRRPLIEQQDTVLQHCRMFGNRSKEDMAVTRLHTTAHLYNIMERMDYMDEQLRQWFIDYSQQNTDEDPSAVFIHLSDDMNIIPCSKSRLVISNVTTIKPYKRVTTFGFQTDCATKVKKVTGQLDSFITSMPNYVQDEVFEVDAKDMISVLKKIRSTYIYNRPIDDNVDYEWNEEEMIACIKYATQHTNGKMYCLHRVDRNMSRVRANGNFVDAPEDGKTDTPLARKYAKTMPVLMLLRQNGKEKNGWRGAPFYWPSLMLQGSLAPAIFETK